MRDFKKFLPILIIVSLSFGCLITQQSSDDDQIVPVLSTISTQFVEENEATGKLFVISGKLKNNRKTPRKSVKMECKLTNSAGTVVKTAWVYGGNTLSKSELLELNIIQMNARLTYDANIIVPNQEIDFMVVFSGLPEDMAGYELNVSESMPI